MAGVFQFGYTGKAADGSTCCDGSGGGGGPGGCRATVMARITPGTTLSPGAWSYDGPTATAVFNAPQGSAQVGSITITTTGPNDGGLYPSRCVTITPPCDQAGQAPTTVDLTQPDLSDCYIVDSRCTDSGCNSPPGPNYRGLVPTKLLITVKSSVASGTFLATYQRDPSTPLIRYYYFTGLVPQPDGSDVVIAVRGNIQCEKQWHDGSGRSTQDVFFPLGSLCMPTYCEGGIFDMPDFSQASSAGGQGSNAEFAQRTGGKLRDSYTLVDGCNGGGSSYSGGTSDNPQVQPMMASAPMAALAPSPSLRVGLFCPWLLYGGAEAWQLSLADGLANLLGGLIAWQGAACINQPAEPGMVADVAALMPVAYGWQAARDLAAKCDVIITWHVADYGQLYQGLPTPPRTIFVCHLPSPWGSASAALLASVDAFVAVSELALAPIPTTHKARSSVIWNAVDEARLTPARTRAQIRSAWGVSPTATVIGYLGRLSDEKNPDAALELAKAAPELTVVIVGDGPLRSSLAIGAPSNLRIVGPDHDKAGVIGACDVMLVPSDYESFGLTIAEANWLGVPVDSTPVGLASIRPSLTRPIPIGATGATIAAAIRADLADKVGTAKRVADAQTWAKANLTLDRMARQYAALLATLSPAVIAGKINAFLTGTIRLSALSPNLDLNARIDTCPHARGVCFCSGVTTRPCDHPDRPKPVDPPTCVRCQEGEFDR